MPRYKPILERFQEKVVVNEETGCWDWQGSMVGLGYGVIHGERGRGHFMAHRFSYEHHIGPIPAGLIVLHSCDNAACVNPKHLKLGTHADNMADMARKGRARLLSAAEAAEVRKSHNAGASLSAIARDLGVSRPTVTRAVMDAREFAGEGRKGSKYYTILTEEQRAAVRFALAEGKMSIMAIAKVFDVDRRTVRNIRDGKNIGQHHKLTKEKVEEIVALWEAGFRQAEIGRAFGINQTHVSKIVRGKSWSGVRSKAKLPRQRKELQ